MNVGLGFWGEEVCCGGGVSVLGGGVVSCIGVAVEELLAGGWGAEPVLIGTGMRGGGRLSP